MAEKKPTVFQSLERALKGNWNDDTRSIVPHVNSYDMSNVDSVIFKTTDKAEHDKVKLELQQNKYLKDRWIKANVDLSVAAFSNLSNVKLMYRDADLMDAFPEIGAALDTVSEEACLYGDTTIKLLDGRERTIRDLYRDGETNLWLYSVDQNGKCLPTNVGRVIYKGEKPLYEITLDDGTCIKCTEDHLWMLSDGTWKKTCELRNGDSMMSIYDKIDSKGYEKIKSTAENKFTHTHRIVAENVNYNEKEGLAKSGREYQLIVIHHTSFNKANNDPRFLKYMFWDEHEKLHTDLNAERWKDVNFSKKMRAIMSENGKSVWKTKGDTIKAKLKEVWVKRKEEWTKEDLCKTYGRKEAENGMYGVHRFGSENPNFNTTKNHINDIPEEIYVDYVVNNIVTVKEIAEHFNMLKTEVVKYNKMLCEKYGCKRFDNIKYKVLSERINQVIDKIKNSDRVFTLQRISELSGINYHVVCKFFEINNIKLPKSTKKNVKEYYIQTCDITPYVEKLCNIEGGKQQHSMLKNEFGLTKKQVLILSERIRKEYGITSLKSLHYAVDKTISISSIKKYVRENENVTKKDVEHNFNISGHVLLRICKTNGYKDYLDLKKSVSNHRITSIKQLDEIGDVYDMLNSSVNHSFSVKCKEGHVITHNCVTSEEGNVVNVYSESDRIKSILEDLFVNRLNLQVTAPMIIRAMCKYGNQFMLLDIDNKLGVKGWRQLPVFNVERLENGITNPYGAGQSLAINNTGQSNDTDMSTKFVWLDENNSQVPFRNWQIAHFRLLTNSICLPYGCSYLNSARRHWRLLSLMEDMMLIYRLERSIERRVYKIYVGAIDDADVQAYVENIANNFKRTPIIDPMTGQIDLRKNILPVHKDTPIPLLDGRTITIEELSKELNEGKENYVYSVQDGTLGIVPGKVVWCGKNYTADKLVKITLDDDSYMIMAPEHEVVMRDGSKKRADLLLEGESVMPLYKKIDKNSPKLFDRYEKVYNPSTGKFEPTHRLIAESVEKGNEKFNTVHHKDFNKYNNNPSNLLWMDYHEHHKMHGEIARRNWMDPEKRKNTIRKMSESCKGRTIPLEIRQKISDSLKKTFADSKYDELKKASADRLVAYNRTEEGKEKLRKRGFELGYRKEFEEYNHSDLHKEHDAIRSAAMVSYWKNADNRRKSERNMTVIFDDTVWNNIDNGVISGEIYSLKTMIGYINSNLIDYLILTNTSNKLKNYKKVTKPLVRERIKEHGFNSCDDYLDAMEETYGLLKHKDRLLHEKSERSKRYNLSLNMRKKRFSMKDGGFDEVRNAILRYRFSKSEELVNYINENLKDFICGEEDITYGKLQGLVKRWGFSCISNFLTEVKKNHKVKSVEYISGDDVYCMTVVGPNGEDDRHNFALYTWEGDGSVHDSGVFVSNCTSDDIFIPVRDPNAPTPIDTLPAAQNLTAIDDIKYIQNKVLTALRIPKTFLNFEENAGDGKNLALMDIRFTRVINRIQQAFLMELTKVASIHLYMLGFGDDITNFSITMNNPSTQAEQLQIENLQKMISAVRDAVSDPGNGIPAMSMTSALKRIMKMSDKEIKNMFEEIRLEKAIAAEFEKTTQIIKRTGIFDTVDRIYGEPGAQYQEDMQGPEGGPDGGMGGGGGFGGGGFGGGLDDLGGMGEPEGGDINGAEGSEPTSEMGGAEGGSNPTEGGEPTPEPQKNESVTRKGNLLTESKMQKRLIDEDSESLFEKLLSRLDVETDKKKVNESAFEYTDIYDKSLMINEEYDRMIKSLDEHISKDDSSK